MDQMVKNVGNELLMHTLCTPPHLMMNINMWLLLWLLSNNLITLYKHSWFKPHNPTSPPPKPGRQANIIIHIILMGGRCLYNATKWGEWQNWKHNLGPCSIYHSVLPLLCICAYELTGLRAHWHTVHADESECCSGTWTSASPFEKMCPSKDILGKASKVLHTKLLIHTGTEILSPPLSPKDTEVPLRAALRIVTYISWNLGEIHPDAEGPCKAIHRMQTLH